MTIKLEGFRELERALNELPKATGKNVLRRVAKGSLQEMMERAQSLAPIGEGDLKVSIVISTKRTRRAKKSTVRATGPARFRSDPSTGVEMAMGPSSGKGVLSYATFVEFGTIDTRAQAFMRPAWEGGKEGALEYIKDNLGAEINRAAQRLAKKAAKGR